MTYIMHRHNFQLMQPVFIIVVVCIELTVALIIRWWRWVLFLSNIQGFYHVIIHFSHLATHRDSYSEESDIIDTIYGDIICVSPVHVLVLYGYRIGMCAAWLGSKYICVDHKCACAEIAQEMIVLDKSSEILAVEYRVQRWKLLKSYHYLWLFW